MALSKQDANQVLRAVYDEGTQSLNVNANVVVPPLDISAADGANIAIASQDGTDFMVVNNDGSINITDNGASITVDGTVSANQSGTWDINNISGTVSLPTGAATEATLSSIDGKDFATQTTLAQIETNTGDAVTELQSLNTAFAAEDFATQTTLAQVETNTSNTYNELQIISALDFASETTLNNIYTDTQQIVVNTTALSAVDQLDTPLLDTSSTNIPASSGSPVQVVSSLNSDVKKIVSVEDIGEFIGLYTGAPASETLLVVLPLGGGEIDVSIPGATRISLRAMENTAISTGKIAINFLG